MITTHTGVNVASGDLLTVHDLYFINFHAGYAVYARVSPASYP